MQPCRRHRAADLDQASVPKIAEQDPYDTDWQVELGRQVGNRDRDSAQPQG